MTTDQCVLSMSEGTTLVPEISQSFSLIESETQRDEEANPTKTDLSFRMKSCW